MSLLAKESVGLTPCHLFTHSEDRKKASRALGQIWFMQMFGVYARDVVDSTNAITL